MRWHKQITECLARTSSDSASQLVQLAKTKILCIVDDYGVDVRHVDTAFNDCRGKQHVIIVVGKVDYCLFQLFGWHLAVSDSHTSIGNYTMNHVFKLRKAVDAIVDKKHLPVTRHFKIYRFTHYIIVQCIDRSQNRIAIGRRRGYGTQVTSTHKRELQCTRNRSSRHRERVHVHL